MTPFSLPLFSSHTVAFYLTSHFTSNSFLANLFKAAVKFQCEGEKCVHAQSADLAVRFLASFGMCCDRSLRPCLQEWVPAMHDLLLSCDRARKEMATFLLNVELRRKFLLDCNSVEVRSFFGELLFELVQASYAQDTISVANARCNAVVAFAVKTFQTVRMSNENRGYLLAFRFLLSSFSPVVYMPLTVSLCPLFLSHQYLEAAVLHLIVLFFISALQETVQMLRQTTPLCKLVRDIGGIGHEARLQIVTQRFLSAAMSGLPMGKQQGYDARFDE